MEKSILTNELKQIEMAIKRAEHSLYVSLKYNKTSDVLKLGLKHLLEAYDIFFDIGYFLLIGEEDDLTKKNIFYKMKVLEEDFESRGKKVNFKDYMLLRQLNLLRPETIGEFRKNLALIYYIEDNEIEITQKELFKLYEVLVDNFDVLSGKDEVY